MYYSVRHLTKFVYETPVSESAMEVRMHPRSDTNQRCLTFHLSVSPRCRVFSYRDHLANNIHHFDIAGHHTQLVIVAESLVELQPLFALPQSLPAYSWEELDILVAEGDYWEFLFPSEFARQTPLLEELAKQIDVRRRDDPLSVLRELNTALYQHFDYVPQTTHVDSPIDDALQNRSGVCQDFAHVMIALVRGMGIPCRYVSGYLYRTQNDHERSAMDASHAWVEALLPQVGWVGFDPTNDLIAGERHIRTANGRDYADVPPTKGVYRGRTTSELSVAVRVGAYEDPPALDQDLPIPEDWSILVEKAQESPAALPLSALQQMQQQQ
jgi:transglutaminase-like putative cysteine protease